MPLLHIINELAVAAHEQAELSSGVVSALQEVVNLLKEEEKVDEAKHSELKMNELKLSELKLIDVTLLVEKKGVEQEDMEQNGLKVLNGVHTKHIELEESNSDSHADQSDQTDTLRLALERERLSLLTDIQKHEYIGDRLRELLEPNKKIIADVKLYLANRQHIHDSETTANEERLAHYETRVVEPTVEKLRQCTDTLHSSISEYSQSVQQAWQKSLPETLSAPEFQANLNGLVDALNKLAAG